MQAQLFEGYKAELASINERLSAGRRALEAIEDGEQRGISKHNIVALEILLATVKKSLDGIVVAEMQAEEAPKKFRRWREAVAKAREARETLEGFTKPIDECQRLIDQAENSFQTARAALTDHRNHPIENPYPSQSETRKWEARCSELQSALSERSAELRALKEKINGLRSEWMKAMQTFSDCELRERMTRLPNPEQKQEGFGTLSAVS